MWSVECRGGENSNDIRDNKQRNRLEAIRKLGEEARRYWLWAIGERKPQSLCESSSIENREQMRDLSVTSA